jgi:uncharacterized protein (TIGR02679 family)
VWVGLRRPLELRGRPTGLARLRGLPRASRHALADLLGRPLVRDEVAVDLAELDGLLSARAGVALTDVVRASTGGPLRDRPAERAAASRRRAEPLDLLADLAAASPALRAAPWVPRWLDELRRTGILARDPDWDTTVRQAVAAVQMLQGGHGRRWQRGDLAAACAYDAHALDDGRPLGAVVVRALAAAAQLPAMPGDARRRRELWERFGVAADHVSSTVLTLGLRPRHRGAREDWLHQAADRADPVHLTMRDLRRLDPRPPPGTVVLVCENPRVLEASADAADIPVPVVCTAGSPALVAVELLERLRDAGAYLRYHGDFDWPGIEIANRLLAAVETRPWRMSATDYEAAVPATGGLPLSGRIVEPAWDTELGPAMRHHAVAVHEEAVLPDLLAAARRELTG